MYGFITLTVSQLSENFTMYNTILCKQNKYYFNYLSDTVI